MAHFSRLSQVVIDVPEAEHDATVGFWRDALALPLKQQQNFPDYHGAKLEGQLGLLVQRLGEGAAKVHLDMHTSDRAAEVARLLALGATMVDDGEHWAVMRDPAGLVFCVVPDPGLDESNAHAWPD
jgi:catechol 2,3-dioxygenase-like lactoylglutathione lyase family enzyme